MKKTTTTRLYIH